jgi:hypothetical protein
LIPIGIRIGVSKYPNAVIWNAKVGFRVKAATTKVAKKTKGFISSRLVFLRTLRCEFSLAEAFRKTANPKNPISIPRPYLLLGLFGPQLLHP